MIDFVRVVLVGFFQLPTIVSNMSIEMIPGGRVCLQLAAERTYLPRGEAAGQR